MSQGPQNEQDPSLRLRILRGKKTPQSKVSQCWTSQFSLSLLSFCLCSLLRFITNKDNRCTPLFLVSIYFVFKTQDFLTLFSLLRCFPAPPWTAHLQPPISFTPRKGEEFSACPPNPCISYETRTEMLWNICFSSPAVQSGNTEQEGAFLAFCLCGLVSKREYDSFRIRQ